MDDLTSAHHKKSVVTTYLTAHSQSNVDGIMALFADDASVWDPADAEPFRGSEAIRQFFSTTHENIDSLTLTLAGPISPCGDFAAFSMMVVTTIGEMTIEIDVVEIMKFDENGLICEMKAYWDMADSRTS